MPLNEIKRRKGSSSHHKIPKHVLNDPILKRMWLEIHRKNSNFILLIVGLPGKGKSWTALQFLYSLMVDENGKSLLTPDNCLDYIAFNFSEFNKAVQKHSKRSVIIWEEAASIESANARRFWDEISVYMATLFHTMRYKNQIAILTLPSGHFLDKQLRTIVHATLNMGGHDDVKSWGKFKFHSFNPELDKQYSKYARFLLNGSVYKVSNVKFGSPPKWLTDKYEVKQQAWKDSMQVKVDLFTEKVTKEREFDKHSKLKRVLDLVETRWQDFYDNETGKFLPELIATDDGINDVAPISLTYARSIANALKFKLKKGHLV